MSAPTPAMSAAFDSAVAEAVAIQSIGGSKPLNDFLVPLSAVEVFSPGSTDVGDVSWLTPTAQFISVTVPSNAPGHSWQQVTFGRSSVAKKGMKFAAKVIAATAIDLFESKELLAAAREEWTKASLGGYVCPIPDGAVPTAI